MFEWVAEGQRQPLRALAILGDYVNGLIIIRAIVAKRFARWGPDAIKLKKFASSVVYSAVTQSHDLPFSSG
jgi:hypothetical protein